MWSDAHSFTTNRLNQLPFSWLESLIINETKSYRNMNSWELTFTFSHKNLFIIVVDSELHAANGYRHCVICSGSWLFLTASLWRTVVDFLFIIKQNQIGLCSNPAYKNGKILKQNRKWIQIIGKRSRSNIFYLMQIYHL